MHVPKETGWTRGPTYGPRNLDYRSLLLEHSFVERIEHDAHLGLNLGTIVQMQDGRLERIERAGDPALAVVVLDPAAGRELRALAVAIRIGMTVAVRVAIAIAIGRGCLGRRGLRRRFHGRF